MTGQLHLGHALTVALEDSIIRYHAGIATQALFDRELQRSGERKEDIGREMYVDMVGEERDRSA